ncbi:uncharacterized protein ACNLHF_013673 [Anomaloglossus baeobatrachus]|uniref:uncharacterized protein LOC142294970 n=1 Tax=Anomaloglossus baeobatrachus TaxID=238106 RepID=UPI003F502450
MERLMPTNCEAQKQYLPFPLYEKRPEPPSVTPEEQNEEEITEPMAYLEEKDLKEDEKDKKKKEKKDLEDTQGTEQKYLTSSLNEKRPEPPSMTPRQWNQVVISDPMKYREVKGLDEDEEDTKNKKKKDSGAKHETVKKYLTFQRPEPPSMTPGQWNQVVISDPMKYQEVKDLDEDEEDTKKKKKKYSGAKQGTVQKHLTFPLNKKRPEPPSMTPGQWNQVVISDPMKYREVKDLDEDEEDTKKRKKKDSGAKRRMVQNTTHVQN